MQAPDLSRQFSYYWKHFLAMQTGLIGDSFVTSQWVCEADNQEWGAEAEVRGNTLLE